MPKKNEYTISLKHDEPAVKETSDSLASKIEQFLQSGGQINQIPSGVSGQISLGEKARLAREEQQKKQQAAESSEIDTLDHEAEHEADEELATEK